MRSNIKPQNRRLLEALYYIDEEVLADVLADITVPEPSAPLPRKKAVIRSIKYAALLAACALLVGAVFPVITQLMNHFGESTGTTPPAGTIQYSQYADYVLTEDDLAAINAAWAKEHTSVFADSVEDAMRRTRNGGHYFGKYGDTIVIWRPSVTCLVLEFSMNGHTFTFGSGTMYFFNGGQVYDQYDAGVSGLLTDEQIEALYKYYTDEYLNCDNELTKPAPETSGEKFEIPIPEGGLTYIEHVGEVPSEFKTIISDNLFSNITIINDILVRYDKNGSDHIFQLYNKHGKLLREASVTAENAHMQKMYIDSKGNLIVYFSISYQDASYKSIVYAKIVKFDTNGKIVFNTDITPNQVGSFDYMVETDYGYIFAGSIGIRSNSFYKGDVYLVEMSHYGVIRNTLQIGSADEYDNVVAAEKAKLGVRLYLCLQETEEGQTRPKWNYYRCDLSDDLTDPKYTEISESDLPEDEPYYYVNGKGYFSIDEFLSDYEWSKHRGSHLIEYDDFVLFVGYRYTSDFDIIENGLSSIFSPKSLYTETVYAAYTKTGELIWRTAVDSTDYEFLRSYYSQ